jgi:hypothetical protein
MLDFIPDMTIFTVLVKEEHISKAATTKSGVQLLRRARVSKIQLYCKILKLIIKFRAIKESY